MDGRSVDYLVNILGLSPKEARESVEQTGP
jgi:hypothetical protein